MNQVVQIGGAPLAVQVLEMPPYVVGRWVGAGAEAACEVASHAAGELLSRPAECLVLDLADLHEVSEAVAGALAQSIVEAQRLGRDVCLVRCSDQLFQRLQEAGVRGSVSHCASLVTATKGLFREQSSTLELHLRSMPQLLYRVRNVVAIICKQAGLPDGMELMLKTAVTEAAANAILHGSPEGPRNHVRISFHLDRGAFIVDVADQGPGFQPDGLRPPAPEELKENGFGLHIIRQVMDRVEFFRDDQGMLVRMMKLLGPRGAEWAQ